MITTENNNTILKEQTVQDEPNLLRLIDDLKANKLKPIDLAVYAIHQDELRTYGETHCDNESIARKIGKSEVIVLRSLKRLASEGLIKDYIVEDDGRVIEIPREHLMGISDRPSSFQDLNKFVKANESGGNLDIDDYPF